MQFCKMLNITLMEKLAVNSWYLIKFNEIFQGYWRYMNQFDVGENGSSYSIIARESGSFFIYRFAESPALTYVEALIPHQKNIRKEHKLGFINKKHLATLQHTYLDGVNG
ncbi:hypothetical protein GOBAR_AA29394 [Gossypium barbadense]|uniref:Uncharacterized protein n=1 Tax=Gossypium barbadense TaxID=3634 RepID=A0A2P5WJQ3_GOSBA|nr:hypothetical protein GOBAR_AA29394 [Gossypium barbadense]